MPLLVGTVSPGIQHISHCALPRGLSIRTCLDIVLVGDDVVTLCIPEESFKCNYLRPISCQTQQVWCTEP